MLHPQPFPVPPRFDPHFDPRGPGPPRPGRVSTAFQSLDPQWVDCCLHNLCPGCCSTTASAGYPLVNIQKTIENGHRNSGCSMMFPLNMVIFQFVM